MARDVVVSCGKAAEDGRPLEKSSLAGKDNSQKDGGGELHCAGSSCDTATLVFRVWKGSRIAEFI